MLTTFESKTVAEIMLKQLVRGMLDQMSRFLGDVRIALKKEAPQMAQQSIKALNGQETLNLIEVYSLNLQVLEVLVAFVQMRVARNSTMRVKALAKLLPFSQKTNQLENNSNIKR